MNKAIIIGRLVADPEIRYTQGNEPIAIARYRLAVDRRFKKEGEQTADFIPCIAFSKLADFSKNYLKKGTKIAVVGRIQTSNYTNKEGQKVYTTDIVVEECEFAESKAASGTAQTNPQTAPDDEFVPIPDNITDDLPFK